MNYAAHAGKRPGIWVAVVVTRLEREDEQVIAAMRPAGIDRHPVYSDHFTLMTLE